MKSRFAFLRQHVGPVVVCFGIAFALAQADWMERMENLTLDLRTRLRAKHQLAPDPRVGVIGIDDDTLERFGIWPLARRYYGLLMTSLAAAPTKPAVLGWDLLFPEASPDDEHMIDGALSLPGNVIFAAYSTDEPPLAAPAVADELAPDLTRPIEKVEGDPSTLYSAPEAVWPVLPLRSVALSAFADTPAGPGGVRRVVPFVVRIKDKVYPGLSLQCLLRFWNLTVADVRVRVGDGIYIQQGGRERRIPINRRGEFFVNYRYATTELQRANQVYGFAALAITYDRKYVKKEQVDPPPPELGGKILLVGQVSTGLSDNGPTPLSDETPLVFVHANVLNNILREDYARHASPIAVWIGGVILGVAGLAIFSTRPLLVQAAFSLGVPLLYIVVATATWWQGSLAVPLVAPLLGFTAVQVFMIARRVLTEQRAKEEIKGMFGTYVSPALVNRLVESGQRPKLGGHEEEITAYFSDIQGFSAFSEKLPPDRLVELMNEYLTVCTDLVQEEGGTLDKYIGDAVVTMFGAPIALPDHAYRACVASQRVHQRLGELRLKWKAEGDRWPDIVGKMQSRIGLNSGPCIIGNMGSRTRFNYTMMGDNVNLAARMESGAKNWGVYTMCTDVTKLACEKHGGDRVVFRALGRIVVMGRSQAVPIFEIVGLKETIPPASRECIGIFEAALAKYFARDWSAAIEGFQRSAELEPNQPHKTPGVKNNPSLIYIGIAEQSRREPPPANWDGVYVMTEK